MSYRRSEVSYRVINDVRERVGLQLWSRLDDIVYSQTNGKVRIRVIGLDGLGTVYEQGKQLITHVEHKTGAQVLEENK